MIFDCLFGLYVFSHHSCATGTLLIPKDIYPRKYCQIFTNLFFNACSVIMSPLEKVPFATFYPLQKYLRGTCFFKNDFFKWTQSLKNNLNNLYIFMVYIFSHQSCATGTLLLPKEIYPHKSDTKFSSTYFLVMLKK